MKVWNIHKFVKFAASLQACGMTSHQCPSRSHPRTFLQDCKFKSGKHIYNLIMQCLEGDEVAMGRHMIT